MPAYLLHGFTLCGFGNLRRVWGLGPGAHGREPLDGSGAWGPWGAAVTLRRRRGRHALHWRWVDSSIKSRTVLPGRALMRKHRLIAYYNEYSINIIPSSRNKYTYLLTA